MTPALSFYLLASARAEPLMTRRRPLSDVGPPRAPGELFWIHLGAGQPQHAATTLASRIADERPGADFLLTHDDAVRDDEAYRWVPRPPDYPRAVGDFLSNWRPNAAAWIGGPIWPVLAAKAHQLDLPMLLVNARSELAKGHRTIPSRDLLGLFAWIAAQSEAAGEALERAARRPIEVIGELQRSPRLLDHDEDEHDRLTKALKARPVWYAARATAPEVEALHAAQSVGQGASHRLLLIVQPADVDALGALLERFGARRSTHGVPPSGASAFVADLPEEEGLWYRLASFSFVGGTLGGPEARADPYAPALLGSAILHGHHIAPYAAHFEALDRAGAAWPVHDAAGLGQAVGDLLAPDRAAGLAHHAWSVASEGAEATDRVVEELCRLLDGAA